MWDHTCYIKFYELLTKHVCLFIYLFLLWSRFWCAAAHTWFSSWETSSLRWEWFTKNTTRTSPRPYNSEIMNRAELPDILLLKEREKCKQIIPPILYLELFINVMIIVLVDHLLYMHCYVLLISRHFLKLWSK